MSKVIVFCLAATALPLLGKDVYVSPHGSDADAGTKGHPFRTLQHALASVRGSGSGTTVWLAEGEYFVPNGLTLDAEHSGTPQAPFTIRSEKSGMARITGAREVTGFEPVPAEAAASLISDEAKKNVFVADLKALGFPPLSRLPDKFRAPGCEELIVDGMPMQSARWPNEGFTAFTEVIDAGASDPVHWVTREVYRPGSFRFPSDRAKYWDISRGVYLHGFWCYEWADEALKVASYDKETQELRFAAKHGYGIGNPRHKDSERHFYAIHVFEELDRPGEYYLDRIENKLYFWPEKPVTDSEVRVSVCRNTLLTVSNVSNLILRDLVFENGCKGAVHFKDCVSSRVESCVVRNMALDGIAVGGGRDNHVLGCEITRTGSRAISVSAGDRKSLTKAHCSAVGNHLHHLGRYDWMGGRGVTLNGCGNRVANNLIHHCPTGGVSYGGNEHVLELNEVHHVCLLYSDVGVFYTGRDWASRGNIVRWNYIHSNVNNRGTGSQAIYLDDCDSGDLVVGNIVYGGVGRGVLLGGGRDNTIVGNIFIGIPKGIHVDARGPRGITLDKPGSWNLKAKCEKLDYQSELWRERYPKLATVLDEDPLLPMGNSMKNNLFIAVAKVFALSRDVKEEWLDRENNVTWDKEEAPSVPDPASGKELDLSVLPELWQKVPGFSPIPIEKIGLRGTP